jgi:hypothetical protein
MLPKIKDRQCGENKKANADDSWDYFSRPESDKTTASL